MKNSNKVFEEKPTIGVAMAITNAYSSGYFAYFAAVKSWLGFVDEIVIVDGGSTDGSIEKLYDWVKECHTDKIKIIYNENTHWGDGDLWHWGQICYNMNTALENLKTDWAFFISSDYIANASNEISTLYMELEQNSDCYWIRSPRAKPINGKVLHNIDNRNIIYNLKKIKEDKKSMGMGLDISTNLFSDFPILFEKVAFFLDPENSKKKNIYAGLPIDTNGLISFEIVAYGHFFYTQDQLNYKIQRWDKAFSRYVGTTPARLKQLQIWHKVPKGDKYYSKEEILSWDHPPEIKELIEEYYKEGMIGGRINEKTALYKKFESILLFIFKVERKIKTFYQKKFKGLKAEKDELIWKKVV